MYPAPCRRAGIYVSFHRMRASSSRCQSWSCRDVDVDRLLRSSQSFAMIPTTPALRVIHVAAIPTSNTDTFLSEIGHTSLQLKREQTSGVTLLHLRLQQAPILGALNTTYSRRDRHWAGLHTLLTRRNHVFGPAEGQLHP